MRIYREMWAASPAHGSQVSKISLVRSFSEFHALECGTFARGSVTARHWANYDFTTWNLFAGSQNRKNDDPSLI